MTTHFELRLISTDDVQRLIQDLEVRMYVLMVSPLQLFPGSYSQNWCTPKAEIFVYGQLLAGPYGIYTDAMISGAYVVIFGFYVNILRTRGFRKQHFLHGATISLFILCTAHCTFLLASTEFNNKLDLSVTTSPTLGFTLPMSMFPALTAATNIVYVTSK
jgi:hypothetical protein